MENKDYASLIVFRTKDLKPEGIKYLIEDTNNATWLVPLEDTKFYWEHETHWVSKMEGFTNDASKAWLFGTKEDARAMLVYLFNTLQGYDVTEHEFVGMPDNFALSHSSPGWIEGENSDTAPASPPSPAIEGKEELDWLESFNREEVKNILMEFSYDLQQEKYGGCSTHRHIVSLFIKAHRELFSTPTPPAGAEGEGEKMEQVGLFDILDQAIDEEVAEKLSAAHNMIAGLKERLRITLSNFDVETADLRIARDMIAELEKQLAEEKSFNANWRAIADQYEADKKELEAKVRDLQDWIHSHC